MEELQKIIDWIGEYDKEHECFPHPNLIKMRMKLRVGELQSKVNITLDSVSKCPQCSSEDLDTECKWCNKCGDYYD